jgi:transcriptional regulator with XRE-family HTH domain
MDRKRAVDPSIGKRLREYRRARRVSLRRLALALRLSPSAIADYEHCRCRIPGQRLVEIARVLHCRPADLQRKPGTPIRPTKARLRCCVPSVTMTPHQKIIGRYLRRFRWRGAAMYHEPFGLRGVGARG